jgi:hypothetical protein
MFIIREPNVFLTSWCEAQRNTSQVQKNVKPFSILLEAVRCFLKSQLMGVPNI